MLGFVYRLSRVLPVSSSFNLHDDLSLGSETSYYRVGSSPHYYSLLGLMMIQLLLFSFEHKTHQCPVSVSLRHHSFVVPVSEIRTTCRSPTRNPPMRPETWVYGWATRWSSGTRQIYLRLRLVLGPMTREPME